MEVYNLMMGTHHKDTNTTDVLMRKAYVVHAAVPYAESDSTATKDGKPIQ